MEAVISAKRRTEVRTLPSQQAETLIYKGFSFFKPLFLLSIIKQLIKRLIMLLPKRRSCSEIFQKANNKENERIIIRK
jgi:hypothetical protein